MWLMEFLFIAVFAMGWWPCCCEPPIPSSNCECCDPGPGGIAYDYYYVEISGYANEFCTGCDTYNGTWTVAKTSHTSIACRFSATLPDDSVIPCGNAGFEVCNDPGIISITVGLRFECGGSVATWGVKGSISATPDGSNAEIHRWELLTEFFDDDDPEAGGLNCRNFDEELTFVNRTNTCTNPDNASFGCDHTGATFRAYSP